MTRQRLDERRRDDETASDHRARCLRDARRSLRLRRADLARGRPCHRQGNPRGGLAVGPERRRFRPVRPSLARGFHSGEGPARARVVPLAAEAVRSPACGSRIPRRPAHLRESHVPHLPLRDRHLGRAGHAGLRDRGRDDLGSLLHGVRPVRHDHLRVLAHRPGREELPVRVPSRAPRPGSSRLQPRPPLREPSRQLRQPSAGRRHRAACRRHDTEGDEADGPAERRSRRARSRAGRRQSCRRRGGHRLRRHPCALARDPGAPPLADPAERERRRSVAHRLRLPPSRSSTLAVRARLCGRDPDEPPRPGGLLLLST